MSMYNSPVESKHKLIRALQFLVRNRANMLFFNLEEEDQGDNLYFVAVVLSQGKYMVAIPHDVVAESTIEELVQSIWHGLISSLADKPGPQEHKAGPEGYIQ